VWKYFVPKFLCCSKSIISIGKWLIGRANLLSHCSVGTKCLKSEVVSCSYQIGYVILLQSQQFSLHFPRPWTPKSRLPVEPLLPLLSACLWPWVMEFEKDSLPKSCSRGGVANTSSANWTFHPRIRRRMIYYFSAACPILPLTEISNLIIYRVYQKKYVTDRENVPLVLLYWYNQTYVHQTWKIFSDNGAREICCTSSSTYLSV
jgi:hypothetical protein